MLKSSISSGRRSGWLFGSLLLLAGATHLAAQTDQPIYADSLQNGWEDWSWSATQNFNNASPVHAGAKSLSISLTAWGGLSLHHSDIDTSTYASLSFWIHGGATGGQLLKLYAELGTGAQSAVSLPSLLANNWQQITLSLASLGVANQPNFARFSIQDATGAGAQTFYLDDILLVAATNSTPGTGAPVAITVNAALNQRPISPLIYGVAFASSSQLNELNAPLNRSGGNSETRYNWQLNAHNHAADWYFESLADASATAGAATDDHIAQSKGGGANAMVTVPMIGWMPKLGPGRQRLSSFSIAKYGSQADNDWQWFPDAGNGIINGTTTPITGNDPNDANFQTNSTFQQAWIRHLTNQWGFASNGGVRYYCMDNEHALWHSTHRDVHPVGTTMQEIRDKILDYGAKVKAVDPNALLAGPEEWGWPGYLYSGYDWQWAGAHNDYNAAHFPDRAANGGSDYGPWLLNQMRQFELTNGVRLLDLFTLHIYPQGANQFGNDVSTATQLGRNRSTRALWDPGYVDQSWIGSVIKLVPRMRDWVATYYPGTKTGVTEYNWGAENHINGATAQADILGIFGREGLDLATRWTTPSSSTPTFKAMKMYRNYDGNKSTFGDTSVYAGGPNPDSISIFAALRSGDGAMTIMAINKQLASNAPVNITVTNFVAQGAAQVWQLTSANVIARQSDLAITGNTLSNTLPAQSITLFLIPGGTPPNLRDAVKGSPGTLSFWLEGQAGQHYAIEGSSNFGDWVSFQTNLLASGSLQITVPTTNALRFFRARWVP